MLICSEMGIPHSEFLEWLPEDRSKAVAFQIEKNSKCAMCGTAEWEWEENKHAYEPIAKLCMGCYIKEVASEDTMQQPGVTMSLAPTSTVASAKRMVMMKRLQEAKGDDEQ